MNIKYPIFYCTSFLNILPLPPPQIIRLRDRWALQMADLLTIFM